MHLDDFVGIQGDGQQPMNPDRSRRWSILPGPWPAPRRRPVSSSRAERTVAIPRWCISVATAREADQRRRRRAPLISRHPDTCMSPASRWRCRQPRGPSPPMRLHRPGQRGHGLLRSQPAPVAATPMPTALPPCISSEGSNASSSKAGPVAATLYTAGGDRFDQPVFPVLG